MFVAVTDFFFGDISTGTAYASYALHSSKCCACCVISKTDHPGPPKNETSHFDPISQTPTASAGALLQPPRKRPRDGDASHVPRAWSYIGNGKHLTRPLYHTVVVQKEKQHPTPKTAHVPPTPPIPPLPNSVNTRQAPRFNAAVVHENNRATQPLLLLLLLRAYIPMHAHAPPPFQCITWARDVAHQAQPREKRATR